MHIYKGKVFREQLTEDEQQALVEDFRRYKTTGELPDTFGRDVAYDHPHTPRLVLAEEVKHIHLATGEAPWSVRAIQYHRKSDTHLVYCQGALNDDHYLLIAVLTPDAHAQAKNMNVMTKLGQAAEKFRQQY
ncbi:type II toxin-antitoxin system YafO family toxin [Marinobacterium sedimentorum]|uniref:type II toxin-antitoxin system YafO family toxin n=1 Tax=Marinobacterium sedimentorum TaxID=2927804 RepID=UPI0020C6FC69|nr:type II toxin-antitoxin system YafO family toxin [Marinobacterium sedimentorum]MCP8687736.1 type II toxin-antitoxin system YafO family toxin [Marinobacterium sedimentorum]